MPLDCTNILHRLGKPNPAPDYKKDRLLEPFRHIHAEPGKGVRDQLIAALNHWLRVPDVQLRAIADAVGKLHTASLLIDDIEDGSHLRRGLPSAHTIYGIPQTINAANYMYFLASRELFSLPTRCSQSQAPKHGVKKRLFDFIMDLMTGKPIASKPVTPEAEDSVVDIVTSEILSLHHGQGLEILWRENLLCPSEEEYIDMVVNKTGGLLRIAIRIMDLLSPVETDKPGNLIPLVNLIGVYYQIRDDYMNLQSKEYESKKGLADDLTEGKFSFPIIHGVHSDTTNRLLLNILRSRPTTPAPKNLAITYLEQQGSFDFTFEYLKGLEKAAQGEIKRLGGNPKLERFMELIRCPDLHSPKAADDKAGLNLDPSPSPANGCGGNDGKYFELPT